MSDLQEAVIKSPLLFINLIIVILSECEESHNLEFPSAQDYDVASCSKLCTTENNSPRNDITLPLLEITDFGPPARGGHFVLYVIQRINYFVILQTSFQIRGMKYLPIQIH